MSKKISELTAASALTGDELVEVVQGGTNKKSTAQDIADLGGGGTSGTHTPALTNVTNVSSNSASVFQYMRIGSVVTVSGFIDINSNGAGAVEVEIGIPIASDFASASQCAGVGSTSSGISGRVSAELTNNRAQFNFTASGSANFVFYIHYTYLIV